MALKTDPSRATPSAPPISWNASPRHSYDSEDQGQIREQTLAQAAEFFGSLDPDSYPSLGRVTPILATHDENEQFHAGLDLLMSGLQAQR